MSRPQWRGSAPTPSKEQWLAWRRIAASRFRSASTVAVLVTVQHIAAMSRSRDRLNDAPPRGPSLSAALAAEVAACRQAWRKREWAAAWTALERAHILSQPIMLQHLRVHALMFGLALRTRDAREAAGQLARLALAPLGALTGRIPRGNTGRSNVSAFRPMSVPDDLRHLLGERPGA